MKTSQNFTLMYILLLTGQILICNFINSGPYVMLSILPAIVLCLPPGIPAIVLMLIAAVSGLAVDWLAEGVIGLNMAALFGKEHSERGDGFSIKKNGFSKISAAIIICQAIFLSIYIVIDGAGTRTFLFNLARFAASLLCGFLLSIPVVNMLTSGERQEGWR